VTETARKSSKKKHSSPEQVTPEEALARMKSFSDRKERFIAAIKKSKN
jgi:hypothetical protein